MPICSREAAKWRIQRQSICLVAEDASDGSLAACIMLLMGQPEALFPPPLPSAAPMRPYVGNLAVSVQHRRKGLARALVCACELLGAFSHLLGKGGVGWGGRLMEQSGLQ